MSIAAKKLTPKQELAIPALLTADTHEAAARAVGVSVATVRRWLADPAFADAYAKARRACLESAVREIVKVSGEAVAVLRRNLSCDKPGIEVRAALGILDLTFRAADRDLEQRIQALEAKMGGDSGDTP